MQSLEWYIGKVKIISLVEIQAGDVIQEIMTDAKPDRIKKMLWLQPHFSDEQGNLKAVVQSFIIDTGELRVVVDTCIGNDKLREEPKHWSNLQTQYLKKISDLGYPPENIDIVLCTHLHYDHVGWNTILVDNKWLPTFPRARYFFTEKEFRYWESRPDTEAADDHRGFIDSITPVYRAGLVDLVSVDHQICDEISLFPTHGHTPGHVSILIQSQDEKAVITGDVIHHPCQIEHPEWGTIVDTSQDQARETRLQFLQKYSDSSTLIIGSHFSAPSSGYLVKKDKYFGFQYLAD